MKIRKVSVLGSGTMGIDIALLFAAHGFDVLLWHRICADTAHQRLVNRLDRYVQKEVLSSEAASFARNMIKVTDRDEDTAKADLIIESVVEDYEIKTDVLCRFNRLIHPGCILVTNTSSLSINRLGRELGGRNNFAGFHFFNPATKMELIEIVVGEQTSAETVETLRQLSEKLGKKSVNVKDTPGFIVNRLLMIQINSAIRLLDEGGANAEDIDLALMAGLGHKKGPLALADFIGLDVVSRILTSIYEATGEEAYKPSRLLNHLVGERKLGKKSGSGFFQY